MTTEKVGQPMTIAVGDNEPRFSNPDGSPATWIGPRPVMYRLLWLVAPLAVAAAFSLFTHYVDGRSWQWIAENIGGLVAVATLIGVLGFLPTVARQYSYETIAHDRADRQREALARSWILIALFALMLAGVLKNTASPSGNSLPALAIACWFGLGAGGAWLSGYLRRTSRVLTAEARRARDYYHDRAWGPLLRLGDRASALVERLIGLLFWLAIAVGLLALIWYALALIGPIWMIPIAIVIGALIVAAAIRRQ